MSDTSPVHNDPDLPQGIVPRLGIPGRPDFFASVLRFIRTSAPGFPLDPVIFQSIILSVMAGNKHVLLRVKDEDISIVQSLATLVSNAIPVYLLVGDCPLLFLVIEPSSSTPPVPSGMSSFCPPDIYGHTWLHDSQTQDIAIIGHVALVLYFIHIFFAVSRFGVREIRLFFQKACKTPTLSANIGRSPTADQRTNRLIIRHVSHVPGRTSRRAAQTATTFSVQHDGNTFQFIRCSRG